MKHTQIVSKLEKRNARTEAQIDRLSGKIVNETEKARLRLKKMAEACIETSRIIRKTADEMKKRSTRKYNEGLEIAAVANKL